MASQTIDQLKEEVARRYEKLHDKPPPPDFLGEFRFERRGKSNDPAALSFRRLRDLGVPRILQHPLIQRDAITLDEGTRALDSGCGPGDNTRWLQERCGEVIGIDSSPNTIALGRAFYLDGDLRYPTFIVGDCKETGLGDGHFKVVYSGSVIHTMSSSREAGRYCGECGRVLAHDGNFFGSALCSDRHDKGFTRLQLTRKGLGDMLAEHFGPGVKLEFDSVVGYDGPPRFRAYFSVTKEG